MRATAEVLRVENLRTSFVTPRGVMPIARLCAICFVRRRSVSPIARFIESVMLSP